MFTIFYKSLAIVLLSVAISACGQEEPVEKSAQTLYDEARELVSKDDVKGALDAYIEVEKQHPQNPLATKATIEAINYAYTKLEYEKLLTISQNFLQFNPKHKDAPRILYLRALSYYERISDIGRDQGMTTLAAQSLNEVILSFPDSEYATFATYKLQLTTDHIAGKNLDVGRFYLERGDYQAAVGRFNEVILKYSYTSHAPEAFARLIETYLILGLNNEALRTTGVFSANHNGNKWYKYVYELLLERNLIEDKSGNNNSDGKKLS